MALNGHAPEISRMEVAFMNERVRRRLGALVLGCGGLASPVVAADAVPARCSKPEHRQFDFWVGEWQVQNPEGDRAGENSIKSILGGCVIEENWRGARGANGTSVNVYDATRGVWHQTWVDDQGGLLQLEGHAGDGRMVLEGQRVRREGGSSRERITWEKKSADRVRQLWESSTDDGKTWQVQFDGLYVRSVAKGD
jgi:hypothetical protein